MVPLFVSFLSSYIAFSINFKNCDTINLYGEPTISKMCNKTSEDYIWNVYNDDNEMKIIPSKVLESHQVCIFNTL